MSATEAPERLRARAGADRQGSWAVRALGSRRALERRELSAAGVRWPRPSRLAQALKLPRGRLAAAMRSLGVVTVGELLEHLPADNRQARTIAALRAGEQATVAVTVRAIRSRPVRRRGMRPLVQATVADGSASMQATFFNQPWLLERYVPGTALLLHGKADGRGGFRVIHHAPGGDGGAGGLFGGSGADDAVAHYPATEGVSSTQILTLVRSCRGALREVPEALPAAMRAREDLPDRASALAALHFPRDAEDPRAGRARLAFEELLLVQLLFLRRRARRRAVSAAHVQDAPPSLTGRWLQRGLPFAPTDDQRRAIEEIRADMAQPRAMQRLLMGEVGSGKTVVALWAMLRALECGHQAALMAPTETLAEQHFATLQRLLGAEPVTLALLTGSTPARRREGILAKLASGELSLVVGTHALIEADVRFMSLALAVIDEQHRFGVRQRAALDGKGTPHMLHMTATPIPRTLALAGYGDLDTSVLRELPSGRRAITTRVISSEAQRSEAYDLVRGELRAGRQAYVVCPLIDEEQEGEADAAQAGKWGEARTARTPGASGGRLRGGMRAATAELRELQRGELEGFELALLHGGMRPREKQQAMAAFASGAAQVLVATTVIEVGVDVPNATVMLVENAERFGISQLHQLRGRVGRGEHASMCLLMGPRASPRLRALVAHADGFHLAEIDLQLRREGDLVGTSQSGIRQFRVACLPEDSPLQERARAWAERIAAEDPELLSPEHALLGEALRHSFGGEAHEPIDA